MSSAPDTLLAAIPEMLLRRQALVFVERGHASQPERVMQAFDLELAALGVVASTRLRAAIATLDAASVASLRDGVCATIAANLGANRKHEPLFRKFPLGVPKDTEALWWTKVLSHFLQAEDAPCLFCRRTGTTHVLNPCRHVVCDSCFDGSSYSACPVCEHHVDRSSPFFEPTPVQPQPTKAEDVRWKLLDLGEGIDAAAQTLFRSLLGRVQALSPVDRTDLALLVAEYRDRVVPWLPDAIPVRENVALVFGTLFRYCDPLGVLPLARAHVGTATDVLRLLAVYSGVEPSLQPNTMVKQVSREEPHRRWWGKIAAMLGAAAPTRSVTVNVVVKNRRFKLGKLRRPLRRALLEILEGLHPDSLTEDMLRHRSYWVWVGEFLHPHEYAKRFPRVAHAFAIVRGKAPDGTPAPQFRGFYGKVEDAARTGDALAMVEVLRARPGELARRLDWMLRTAGARPGSTDGVVAAFAGVVEKVSTPVLVSLASGLRTRLEPAPVRVYFPKGGTVTGVSSSDRRAPLDASTIAAATGVVERELLRRFGEHPPFAAAIVDDALRRTIVPFNERTASPSAVVLPRGSVVDVPAAKIARMFVHWCEPEEGGWATDLDLSVGLYGATWDLVGVCSYYQLQVVDVEGREIARSSGDLRDAPWPDGASEFVDLDLERARAAGVRYAVMVVNAYSGMTFSALERGFAGLMLRNDAFGPHFDPRTVELKFALQGEHGVFMPLVFDLQAGVMHWVDAYSKGQFLFNNVATSNKAITRICPETIAYFGSGTRLSMYELGLLHAAARAQQVFLRGETLCVLSRGDQEDAPSFLARLRSGEGARPVPAFAPEGPALAMLFRGDVELPEGSEAFALFRERTTATLAASDLLS